MNEHTIGVMVKLIGIRKVNNRVQRFRVQGSGLGGSECRAAYRAVQPLPDRHAARAAGAVSLIGQ